MNDKITDNNDLNGNGLVVDGSTINVTPISNVDSYNASINSNINNGVYQNVSGTVNNSVYTMNDINNMSNNLQSVDNGNFMMVDKANAQSNTMPVVQIQIMVVFLMRIMQMERLIMELKLQKMYLLT